MAKKTVVYFFNYLFEDPEGFLTTILVKQKGKSTSFNFSYQDYPVPSYKQAEHEIALILNGYTYIENRPSWADFSPTEKEKHRQHNLDLRVKKVKVNKCIDIINKIRRDLLELTNNTADNITASEGLKSIDDFLNRLKFITKINEKLNLLEEFNIDYQNYASERMFLLATPENKFMSLTTELRDELNN